MKLKINKSLKIINLRRILVIVLKKKAMNLKLKNQSRWKIF